MNENRIGSYDNDAIALSLLLSIRQCVCACGWLIDQIDLLKYHTIHIASFWLYTFYVVWFVGSIFFSFVFFWFARSMMNSESARKEATTIE